MIRRATALIVIVVIISASGCISGTESRERYDVPGPNVNGDDPYGGEVVTIGYENGSLADHGQFVLLADGLRDNVIRGPAAVDHFALGGEHIDVLVKINSSHCDRVCTSNSIVDQDKDGMKETIHQRQIYISNSVKRSELRPILWKLILEPYSVSPSYQSGS